MGKASPASQGTFIPIPSLFSQPGLKKIQNEIQNQNEKPAPGKRVRGSYVGAEKGAVDDVINEIKLKGFRR